MKYSDVEVKLLIDGKITWGEFCSMAGVIDERQREFILHFAGVICDSIRMDVPERVRMENVTEEFGLVLLGYFIALHTVSFGRDFGLLDFCAENSAFLREVAQLICKVHAQTEAPATSLIIKPGGVA